MKQILTAMQEVRWKENGTLEKEECIVFYSGSTSEHQFGTSFIVNKKCKAYSDRL
jgi:hypothetical protein